MRGSHKVRSRSRTTLFANPMHDNLSRWEGEIGNLEDLPLRAPPLTFHLKLAQRKVSTFIGIYGLPATQRLTLMKHSYILIGDFEFTHSTLWNPTRQ